ncbi:MAG: hypothetical protein ACFFDT_15745 [Candidatus Hodarchaeota archaeon]
MSSTKPTESETYANRQIQTRIFAGSALLGAISWMFVILPDLRIPGWQIALIDFVAIPWIVAFLLFGLRGGLLTSCIGAVAILISSEEGVPAVGAVSKFSAIISLILTAYFLLKILSNVDFSAISLARPRTYAAIFAPATLVRCIVMVFVNLLGLPLVFYVTLGGLRVSPLDIPVTFYDLFWKPMENLLGLSSTLSASQFFILFVLGVFLLNAWLSFFELSISYFVVYRSGLYQEYSVW